MPDLLLELFSEEIPARMQAQAAKDLERLTVGALSDRGLLFEGIKAFAGPRRLTLAIAGLPAQQNDVREELKGPKTDAPQAALDGFLKKTGLTKDQLKVEKTLKGEVYLAVIERKGRVTPLVLAEILPEIMGKFPWPKSMRWPQQGTTWDNAKWDEAKWQPVRWVRPLRSIVCTFDGEVVPFEFAGIKSGNATRGHRFLSSGVLEVRRFEDYEAVLKKAHVVLDAAERAEIISHELKQKAFALGLEPIEDAGLLAEVSGLAEWPTVLIGTIQDQFMDVPAEILQTSMRTHQKYFSLRDPKTGKMANRFALVANMLTKDGGKEIVAGNERVLRARLSDAKFFWDEDRKKTLESRVEKLKGIVFHADLGSQAERVVRIFEFAGEIAGDIGASIEASQRAAILAKADLTSGVVGEFPELQGVMGRYYALHDDEGPEVSDAIRDHYKPIGPSDVVPSSRVTIAVALADKLDLLIGFFAIGEKPTGSGDPFALRRAALGVIRIILENSLRFNIVDRVFFHSVRISQRTFVEKEQSAVAVLDVLESLVPGTAPGDLKAQIKSEVWARPGAVDAVLKYTRHTNDLLEFMADRLRVALKTEGIRHDTVDAVMSLTLGDGDPRDPHFPWGTEDFVPVVQRIRALQAFLKSDDGVNLLAGYKRAANILKAEEKKDGKTYISEVDAKLLSEPAEQALHAALGKAIGAIGPALDKEDFAAAMQQMAALRVPVDAFFEAVKVNADDPKVRANRLHLLAGLRAALHRVADFSKIEG